MAIIYEDRDQLPEAIACYEKAEAKAPDDHLVPFNLSVCLERSDVESAIAACERCLKLEPTFFNAYYSLAAGYHGGLYRRKIVDDDQTSEGLTSQKWASAALAAVKMAPRGSDEARQCHEALELVKTAFRPNYMNVVERMNGTVTAQMPSHPHNDCNTFVKWVDAHAKMMAERRARGR